jgi:anaerobic magnesium-protoporphyrin IX monomethyl ester cyclase
MPPVGRTCASVLLVNYAGYPSSISSLMPDNGLASLAGGLRAAGHRVKILDYATVGMVGRLVPPFYRRGLTDVLRTFEQISMDGPVSRSARARQAAAFLKLKLLARGLEFRRRKVEGKIACEIAQAVREEDADLVGFKLWNGDGFSGPARMAPYIKSVHPDLLIAGGGPQVKFFGRSIFEITRGFDALAVGDGEETILPLAEAAVGRPLSEVPNIHYLREGRPAFTFRQGVQDMNSLPFPLYDTEVYPAMEGNQKVKLLVVEDRRGCENVCAFCVHPSISGSNPRSKSPERVVDEFARAIKDYGISNFRLGGSSSPAWLLRGMAGQIEQRGLDVNWTAFARIKGSQPDSFSYLKKNGLYSLFFGIESASQRVLDAMHKQIRVADIRNVIAASKSAGIFTVGSVIYPAPFDTAETGQGTLAFLREIRPDSVPLQFPGIYPGTEYAREPEEYNFEIIYPSRIDNLLAWAGLKEKPRYDSPEVTRYLMQYKIQLLFPPKFWKPLPWKLNGMTYREFASATQWMYESLKREGILRMLTDEEALMAHLGGYTAADFAELAFVNGFTGNREGMAEMVSRINGMNFAK